MKQLQLSLLCSSWLSILMLFWILLLVHHVLQQPNGCFACVEEERIALLDIKSAFSDDSCSFLPSWNKSIECCNWPGVHCSPTTKHVRHLRLHNCFNSRTLNTSLFLPFPELRGLDLSVNSFNSCVRGDCFGSLAKLDSLWYLDLSGNEFYFINVSSATPKLSNLKYLDMSKNNLNESIVPYLIGLSSLKTLYLDWNDIGGDLLKGLCKIKTLEKLSVGYNDLRGEIPLCLGHLSSLSYFDISSNQIQISFPSVMIKNLTKLKYAFFSNNYFNGAIPIDEFANNTELKILDFSDNNKLEVQNEHARLAPSFQLDAIFLSNCECSSIPMFLSTQHQIKHVDLSNSNIKGNIPTWLFQNKTHLYYLNLKNNSLTGPLIFPSYLKTNLIWFDVSNNKLIGEIHASIGDVIPYIGYLNMSDNFFQGVIPFSFRNLSRLNTLDLSKNKLSGQISNFIEYLENLHVLDLGENNFQGNMFKSNFSLTYLATFIVNRNQLTGEIPNSICKMGFFQILDVSENQLSGTLPSCMDNFQYSLRVFDVRGNNLNGSIPSAFCSFFWLQYLDLSDNHFSSSGLIPSCFNSTHLRYLNLKDNNLNGTFPSAFFGSNNLEVLDIGNNHFIGAIPNWIGTLQNLQIFSLKGNHFKGPIPKQICNLKYLHILDFSQNNLFGEIPQCIHNMGDDHLASEPIILAEVGIGMNESIFPYHYVSNHEFLANMFPASVEYIDFATKERSYAYKGDIINHLSGLDLSCNKLVGQIPMKIGNMTWLRALNLSNNLLYGPIPNTLSRLTEIESLDLSHNMLEGIIPSQLAELHFIESFSVAYNNLSGPTLGMVAQFSTFDEKSYEGNPYLCGPPLVKSCNNISSPLQNQVKDSHKNEERMEHLITIAIFALGFIMGLWGWVALLLLKRSWHYAFFLAVDAYMEDLVEMARNLLAKIKSRL